MPATETVTPSYRGNRHKWLILILGALSAMAPLSIDMYLPSLPGMAHNFHVHPTLAQLSITFCLLGLALGQLVAGPISDRRGRRTPLIMGMAIYALASLSCALTPSIWVLIVLRFFQGTSGAAGIVIARTIARDYFSGPELTQFFGLLMLVNGAAPVFAPVIGGQILRFTSWRGVFVVLTFVGLLILAGVIFGLPESLPPNKRRPGGLHDTWSTMRALIANREFMGAATTQYLIYAAMFGYIAGSPFLLQTIFHLSPQMFSVIFATNGLGIIAAGQTAGRLAGRVGERWLLQCGVIAAGVASLLLFGALLGHLGLAAIVPFLFVVVASVGMVSTAGTSLALQNHGHVAGSASGVLGLGQMLVGALVAPLVGLGGSHDALPMGLIIALCDLGAVLCFFWLMDSPSPP